MLPRLITPGIIILFPLAVWGQTVEKCDLSFLAGKEVSHWTEMDIRDFLHTFDNECRNNVEYSEWSNELLFTLLGTQPELLLATLENEEKSIATDLILNALTSPINDQFDLPLLVRNVEQAKAGEDVKGRVLKHLKVAVDRIN